MNTLGHTLYLRMTDKEGRATYTEHQVWDADLFMAARHAEAIKAGGQAKAEQLTKEQFATRKA